MLKLEPLDHSQTSFWIVDEAFTIGQSAKNQLRVTNTNILPVHATIYKTENKVYVEPFGQEAIVRVNYTKIIKRTPLKIGDIVSFANSDFKLTNPTVRHSASTANSEQLANQRNELHNLRKEVNAHTWKVQQTKQIGVPKVYTITLPMSVGRDETNDIVVTEAHLSRHHAKLFTRNGQLYVKDLDSANGTYVNGEKITEKAVYLADEIAFDESIFQVITGKIATLNATDSPTDHDKTAFRPAILQEQLQEANTKTTEKNHNNERLGQEDSSEPAQQSTSINQNLKSAIKKNDTKISEPLERKNNNKPDLTKVPSVSAQNIQRSNKENDGFIIKSNAVNNDIVKRSNTIRNLLLALLISIIVILVAAGLYH